MAHWKWDHSFSIGIEEIDTQHKQIIKYINDLNIASNYDKMYMIEAVIDHLIDYAKSHFSFEESLMEEAGFPILESHKKSHDAFIERIIFFKERYEDGENISKQLMTDLQFWFINHIQQDDMDYKEIVKEMLLEKELLPLMQPSTNSWLTSLINKYF